MTAQALFTSARIFSKRPVWVAIAPLAVAGGLSAQADVISPWLVNPDNGHSYALLSNATWVASEAEAVSLGGHLATIRDADEQDFIFQVFGAFGGSQRLLWSGLNDVAVEGQFVWSSGEAVTYTHWDAGEPNGAQGGEDYVALYYPNHSSGGEWNDWADRTVDPIGLPFHGVVEIVPEPGSLAFMGLGGLSLLRRRR